jgi:cation diffusion facilitator CzcD-associated flavoprotein CzcO
MSTEHLPFCIVGAGPSGLAAARNLLRERIPFEVLESHTGVGGIWDRSNRRSSVYPTTHTITSKTVTAYSDFPFPEEAPIYPRHDQVLEYLRAYARQAGVTPYIRFGREVTEIRRDGGAWRVGTADGRTGRYRGVIVANGHNWMPSVPAYPGTFEGPTLHSSEYQDSRAFAGRNILVVGAGNSGCDIAVDAATEARRVLLSMRRGYYFVPKFIAGLPPDVLAQSSQSTRMPLWITRLGFRALLRVSLGRPEGYGLPAPDHRLLESPPIVNSLLPYHVAHGRVAVKPDVRRLCGDHVEFTDGSRERVDAIVHATGFQVSIPFATPEDLNWKERGPELYLMAFHPRHDDFFVAGLTDGTGGHFPTVELQTRLIALYIRGLEAGDPAAQRLAAAKRSSRVDLSRGIKFIDSPRSFTQFELATYTRHLRKLIRSLERAPSRRAPSRRSGHVSDRPQETFA